MLDPEARRELRPLTRETADLVARHLVITGRLLDDDPERALAHARAARAMAGRIGVVREASGLAAYAAGEWSEALSELRAARRITGRQEHLAVLADCERALGRPERALAYGDDPAVPGLSQDERVELVIVLSGARRDLGQFDAAVLALQEPARRTSAARPWAPRLWYAYADALLAAGREAEARTWFEKVSQVDQDGQTDAGDRLLELDGVVLEDLGDEDDGADREGPVGMADDELAAYVAEAFPQPVAETAERAAGDPAVGEVGGGGAREPRPSDGADRDGAGEDVAGDAPGASAAAGPSKPGVASLLPVFASPPAAPDDPTADEEPDGNR